MKTRLLAILAIFLVVIPTVAQATCPLIDFGPQQALVNGVTGDFFTEKQSEIVLCHLTESKKKDQLIQELMKLAAAQKLIVQTATKTIDIQDEMFLEATKRGDEYKTLAENQAEELSKRDPLLWLGIGAGSMAVISIVLFALLHGSGDVTVVK